MDRIIRSNAIETSSQSNRSGINLHLTPEMALIYGGNEAPTKTHSATVTTSKTAIKNTGNWSTSLQTLPPPPSILPYLVLLVSVAFFATVVVWALTGKIEEVSFFHAPLVLVATLSDQEVGFVNKEHKVQIKLDADSEEDEGIIFRKVISIFPDASVHEKLGVIYRVEVALDGNCVTGNKQIIKFKVGQTATARIIHQRRIADIFLEPIKQL